MISGRDAADEDIGTTIGATTALDELKARGADAPRRSYVRSPAPDAIEQAWLGQGTSIDASRASLDAYRNRLSRDRVGAGVGRGDRRVHRR